MITEAVLPNHLLCALSMREALKYQNFLASNPNLIEDKF